MSASLTAAWYVYIVRCADTTLYTGATNRIDARIAAHNAGRGSRYTRSRRPVELVYCEEQRGRSEALRREAEIKRMPAEAKRRLLTTATEARADSDSDAMHPVGG
jgi:putative endonuclease